MKSFLRLVAIIFLFLSWNYLHREAQAETRRASQVKAVEQDSEEVSVVTSSLSPQQATISDSIPCLIITNADMLSAFESYAAFKTKSGTYTEVVTVESIATGYTGDSLQIKIRNCIRTYYDTKQTEWVILGGDIGIIPPMYPVAMLTPVLSDLYYSNLDFDWNENGDSIFGRTQIFGDTVDYVSEVYLGRIPCSNTSEANAVINKLLSYQGSSGDTTYQTTAVINGTDIFGNNMGELQPLVSALAALVPSNFTTTEYYQSASGPVKQSIEAGPGIFINVSQAQYSGNFLTNFSNDPWIRDAIEHTFIESISNPGKFGVYLNLTCNNNDLATAEAVSRKYMLNPNGGGVAYLGTTGFSFPLDYPEFHEQIVANIFDNNMPELGRAITEAKTMLIPPNNWIDNVERYTLFGLMLLGDPQMKVWTDSARIFSQDHLASVEVGQNVIIVDTVTDAGTGLAVEGVVVCLMKDTEVYEVGVTDANGIISFAVNFATTGTSSLTASKLNYFLSENFVTVTGPSCCLGTVGNVDGDPMDNTDIADLTFLIDHLFINFPPVDCPEEGNINLNLAIDIADLTMLIDHLFINFPPLLTCP